MTTLRCTCWSPFTHPQPDCPLAREEARQRAIADRLLEDVRRSMPNSLVVDLTGWAPGEITEAYGR